MALARSCNHHETTGVLIEPVQRDSGTGQQRGNRIVRQKAVQQRAAPVSWRGMNDQTGRFVQHQHLRIFMDDVQRHRLGLERLGLRDAVRPQGGLLEGTRCEARGRRPRPP